MSRNCLLTCCRGRWEFQANLAELQDQWKLFCLFISFWLCMSTQILLGARRNHLGRFVADVHCQEQQTQSNSRLNVSRISFHPTSPPYHRGFYIVQHAMHFRHVMRFWGHEMSRQHRAYLICLPGCHTYLACRGWTKSADHGSFEQLHYPPSKSFAIRTPVISINASEVTSTFGTCILQKNEHLQLLFLRRPSFIC